MVVQEWEKRYARLKHELVERMPRRSMRDRMGHPTMYDAPPLEVPRFLLLHVYKLILRFRWTLRRTQRVSP
eukprot:scaffold1322_cov372-Pavlova_lutheri.AAC.2